MYYKSTRPNLNNKKQFWFFCKLKQVKNQFDDKSKEKWWQGIIFSPYTGGVLGMTDPAAWEKITKAEFIKGAQGNSLNPTPIRTPLKKEDDKVSEAGDKAV